MGCIKKSNILFSWWSTKQKWDNVWASVKILPIVSWHDRYPIYRMPCGGISNRRRAHCVLISWASHSLLQILDCVIVAYQCWWVRQVHKSTQTGQKVIETKKIKNKAVSNITVCKHHSTACFKKADCRSIYCALCKVSEAIHLGDGCHESKAGETQTEGLAMGSHWLSAARAECVSLLCPRQITSVHSEQGSSVHRAATKLENTLSRGQLYSKPTKTKRYLSRLIKPD